MTISRSGLAQVPGNADGLGFIHIAVPEGTFANMDYVVVASFEGDILHNPERGSITVSPISPTNFQIWVRIGKNEQWPVFVAWIAGAPDQKDGFPA